MTRAVFGTQELFPESVGADGEGGEKKSTSGQAFISMFAKLGGKFSGTSEASKRQIQAPHQIVSHRPQKRLPAQASWDSVSI